MHRIVAGRAFVIEFASTDKQLAEVFAKCCSGQVKTHKNGKWGEIFKVWMFGKRNYDYLWEKGLRPRKSGKESWPEITSKDLIWHFLRGMFDGDGTVTYSGKNLVARFYSGFEFLEELKRFLESEGMKTANLAKDGAVWRLSMGSRKSLQTLATKMYANSSGLRLSRKYDRFKEFFGSI